MRRHATMGLAFVLPLVVSVFAVAQQPKAAAPKKTTKAATSTSAAGADAGAPTSAPSVTGVTAGDAGAAGPAPTAAAPPPAASGAMDGPQYVVRLRDLEARVDELKDQIRRSHTRLSLLSDTIMSGGAAGARAEVMLQNEMSSAFRMTRALVVMDGVVQYNRQDDTGALADQKEIPLYSGTITPGDHTVVMLLNFQGNGYGVFTYLRGYKFEVKSTHAFTVAEGKALQVQAIALERGGVTTPLEERPNIEWREHASAIGAAPAQPGGSVPGANAAGSATGGSAPAANVSGGVQLGGKQP